MTIKISIEALRERQNNLCGLCYLPMGRSVNRDHVIPKSKGGHATPDNIILVHILCNRIKGNFDVAIVHCVVCTKSMAPDRMETHKQKHFNFNDRPDVRLRKVYHAILSQEASSY